MLEPRSVTRRGEAPCTKIFAPLEKCVGHILKLLHIVKKNFPPLRKLFAPLESQAGYGPAGARARNLSSGSTALIETTHLSKC